MTDYERIQALWALCGALSFAVSLIGWRMYVLYGRVEDDRIEAIEYRVRVEDRIRLLETGFARFTAPEAIADDMEATADLIENRLAGRQAMPRPGVGHARISQVVDPRTAGGWDQRNKPTKG